MFLAPVIDTIRRHAAGSLGRTLGSEPARVGQMAAAFGRGVQSGGIVATAKHLPGHHDITGDPAIEIPEVTGEISALEPGLGPFGG